jgi:hypothetical protein
MADRSHHQILTRSSSCKLGTPMSTLRRACGYAFSEGVPRRSFLVAIVVGTILNLINQGDALLGAAPINWIKMVLTYLVPYAVCTYGAVSFQLQVAKRTS